MSSASLSAIQGQTSIAIGAIDQLDPALEALDDLLYRRFYHDEDNTFELQRDQLSPAFDQLRELRSIINDIRNKLGVNV